MHILEQNKRKKPTASDQLTEMSKALEKEISSVLSWPGVKTRLEFRGYAGFDVVIELLPLPSYSSQKNAIDFHRALRECPLIHIRQLFHAHKNASETRLLLRTANGGVLNITTYTADMPLRSLWVPTDLQNMIFNDVCARNKNVLAILKGLMFLLPEADQNTFDILRNAVCNNQSALKAKTCDADITLDTICDSEAARNICLNVNRETFFNDLISKWSD